MRRKRDEQGISRQRAARRKGATGVLSEDVVACIARLESPAAPARIAQALGSTDAAGLDHVLTDLARQGVLVRNRRGEYGLPDRMDLVRGRISGHPDGFGFLIPDDGGDDLFMPAWEMRRVLHGDRVMASVAGVDRRGRRQGAVVEILERANREIVGRYHRESGIGFVVPANTRIAQELLIPAHESGHAQSGQIVVAEIVEQPDQHRQPVGRIREVLGEHLAPGMEVDIALRLHEVPFVWPPEVIEETAAVAHEVMPRDRRGRKDLRALPLVTIDGADARDFDDAVYARADGDGHRLIVAIADVSSYVAPGTALDAEARRRGTSVYFPNRVVPMLPQELSNGICSLVPYEDRLCLACELRVDRNGAVEGFEFFDAVMRSAARLTYEEVAAAVVERDAGTRDRLGAVVPHLDELYKLYRRLRRRRDRRGALDLDAAESRIRFDEDGKIGSIVAVERNDAHRMIEECMIAANIAAAQFLEQAALPSLYRVHQPPTADRVEDLRSFLGELGLSFKARRSPTPKDYARILGEIGARPDRHLVQTVLLRSLKLAVYSPENAGHFGLALETYTHFTSPIRRYPDLLVHRGIRALLRKRDRARYRLDHEALTELGEHCSRTERRADEATRDVVAWLKCEYMQDRIGEEFEGLVTSVTGFGLFVSLTGIFVEGLVHVTALPNDYYHYDPVHHRMKGERSGRVYRLMDAVRVRLVRVDLDDRKIDFALAGEPPRREDRAGSRRRRRRRRGAGPRTASGSAVTRGCPRSCASPR
ncbi:MAG: ribonuclease R, partial [Gammaproteobacteria bacterium]